MTEHLHHGDLMDRRERTTVIKDSVKHFSISTETVDATSTAGLAA